MGHVESLAWKDSLQFNLGKLNGRRTLYLSKSGDFTPSLDFDEIPILRHLRGGFRSRFLTPFLEPT
jgi:hypothetical protein